VIAAKRAAPPVGEGQIMKLIFRLAATVLLAFAASLAAAAEIAPDEAAKHVGKTATVCGVVGSARYAERSTKQPTFLNLGRPHPNGSDRAKFGTPETTFAKKRICATGVISLFQDRPEMKLQDPSQLSLAPR
jgi:hypothetical protein